MTISGRAGEPMGAQIDGVTYNLGLCGGTSNFGKYECTTHGFSTGVPAGYDTALCPGQFQFDVTAGEGHHIVRFDSGDVLIMVVDLGQPNYNCTTLLTGDFLGAGVQYRSWRIVGGSGQFDGATG